MMIEFVDECSSTQKEIIEGLKNSVIKPPYCLVAKRQNGGVGSRGSEWESEEGNLYFSFCIDEREIPSDVPLSSMSIYFAFLMKEHIASLGSNLWLKWPNDFYVEDKKIGGVITTKIKNSYVCGMGINIAKSPDYAGVLDIQISANSLVLGFVELLKNKISWKQIFSKFLLEFEKSKNFTSHINNEKISLHSATLCEDGSIFINNKKVYGLR
ncbi:biotin--[acetyl-CoA-carboxylase] ligase [Campylobacter geochelonis]|nr:biotin--[acetyl-CoA-carboxylase] ligase [Campylobacter geochelonis]QKF70691.1 biotin-[acetyl-CoA-carboxylase] ligase [Campylobacter geochelonis]